MEQEREDVGYLYRCAYCVNEAQPVTRLESNRCERCGRNSMQMVQGPELLDQQKAEYEGLLKKGFGMDTAVRLLDSRNYKDYIALSRFAFRDNEGWDIKEALSWDKESGELLVQEYKPKYEGKAFVGYDKAGKRVIPPLNLRNIELSMDEGSRIFIKDFERHVFLPVEKYLDEINVPKNYKALALQGLSLLPATGSRPAGLELREEEGHLRMPRLEDVYIENDYARWLLNVFKVSGDIKTLKAKEAELWEMASPKQRTDIMAAIGIPVMNALITIRNLSVLKPVITSFGSTNTGKTWIYRTTLRLYWGLILNNETLLTGDAISKSTFRFFSTLDSTNLPVLIDEATPATDAIMDAVKAMTMGGGTLRGRQDQSVRALKANATLITNAQSDIFMGVRAISDDLAMKRRTYKQHYTSSDIYHDHTKYIRFVDGISEGGLVFEYLKQYSIEDIMDAMYYYLKITDGDVVITGILLGLALTGRLTIENTDRMVWEPEGQNPLLDAYELILRDVERMEAGRVSFARNGQDYMNADSVSKDLGTMLVVEQDSVYITSAYIKWLNANKGHPLHGKFANLGDLKQLATLFEGLKPEDVYDHSKNKRIGGREGWLGKYACVPLSFKLNVTDGNTVVTHKVTDKIQSVNQYDVTDVTLNPIFSLKDYLKTSLSHACIQNENPVTREIELNLPNSSKFTDENREVTAGVTTKITPVTHLDNTKTILEQRPGVKKAFDYLQETLRNYEEGIHVQIETYKAIANTLDVQADDVLQAVKEAVKTGLFFWQKDGLLKLNKKVAQ